MLALNGLHAQSFRYAHYTVEDGLPHDVCYQAVQDRAGYIWITSDDGLARFDGASFTHFGRADGLSSDYPIQIVEADSAHFFVAMWKGMICEIRNGVISALKPSSSGGEMNNHILIEDSLGIAWQRGNLQRFHTGSRKLENFRTYQSPGNPSQPYFNTPTSLVVSLPHLSMDYFLIDSQIYAFGSTKGLWAIDWNQSGDMQAVVPQLLGQDTITSVQRDSQGQLLIGAVGKAFQLGPSGLLTDDLPNLPIRQLIRLNDKQLLIMTASYSRFGKNLFLYDLEEKRKVDLVEAIGISSSLNWMMLDRQKNLWIATFGDGVYCVKNPEQGFLHQFKNLAVNDIKEGPDGEIFLGTENGIKKLGPNGKLTALNGTQGEIENIFFIGDQLMFTRPDGTYQYKHQQASEKLSTRWAFHTTYIPERNEILGMNYTSISRASPEKVGEHKVIQIEEKANFLSMSMIDGEVWAGTKSGARVYGLDNDKWVLRRRIEATEGLCDPQVNDIIKGKDGRIWFATESGISYLKDDQIYCINSLDGMLNERARQLLEDQYGRVWIASERGLLVYDGEWFYGINQFTGLAANDVNSLMEKGQELWVGSTKGISRINLDRPLVEAPTPRVQVETGRLRQGGSYPEGSSFRFELSALNFLGPQTLFFRFRLNEGTWFLGDEQSFELTNLPPGEYQVDIQARTINSRWGGNERISFSIKRWWQERNFWLISITAVLLVLLILLIARRRIQEMRVLNRQLATEITHRKRTEAKLAHVRSQVARDFHDEIGHKLANITILSNLARLKLRQEEESVEPLLDRIEAGSKSLHSDTRDFIWSIDSNSDLAEELFGYLRDFGLEFFESMDIRFEAVSDAVEGTALRLPPYWSRNILLIFKEAMTNAARHANCRSVRFIVAHADGKLRFCLENDGEKVQLPENASGRGLKNMQHRALELGGVLRQSSQKTELSIQLPEYQS
ncbi:MAG: histidine kinase [Bacteroidota bacterium]